MTLLALLAACTADTPDRLLVYHYVGDGQHVLEPREVPLDDPRHVVGDLAVASRDGGWARRTGHEVTVDYVVRDGVGIALDEDGLGLWSAYEHIAGLDDDLTAWGYDLTPIYPVQLRFGAVGFDNMSMSCPSFTLNIWAGNPQQAVPFPSETSIVRHEMGHALDSMLRADPGQCVHPLDGTGQSIEEGFADMVSSLTLDTPHLFVTHSFGADRDLLEPHVADKETLDEAITYDTQYPLGSVLAAFMWDIREATDPKTAFDLSVAALVAQNDADWDADRAEGLWSSDRFVLDVIANASGTAREAACAAAPERFPLLDTTDACSP